MNNLKQINVGVDKPIKVIQTFLYNSLGYSNINAYGRVYKQEKGGKTYPVFYTSDKDYDEVLFDDSINVNYFFNIGNTEKFDINGDVSSDCEIIFTFDLSTLKGDDSRLDEEVKQEVIGYLQRFKAKFNIKEIVTGLEDVYSDFSGVSDRFKDIQPYFHFKIKGEILYNINLKCTQ